MNEYLLEIRGLFIQFLLFFTVVFVFSCSFSSRFLFFILDLLSQFSCAKGAIYTELAEVFCIKIKTAFYCSLLFSFPFLILQICRFLVPALYMRERLLIVFFMLVSVLFFYAGVFFSFKMVLPAAIKFFSGSQNIGKYSIDLIFLPKVSEFISLVFSTSVALGIMFQLPIILFAFVLFKIINYITLVKGRRFFIVGAFAISAIVTPPDVLSQLVVAAPILFVYEFIVLFAKLSETKKKFFFN